MTVINELHKPFFVLAPMDDVTDTVFRQIIASTAAPDLFFTEFVNVDGLQSAGRDKLLFKLRLGSREGVSRALHLDGVQGDNEKRAKRTNGTLSESRKQSTQQSVKNLISVSDSVRKQDKVVYSSWPVIAQIWGKNPENFYKTAQDLVKMGYDGIDLNFGCPAVAKNGTCIGMINNRQLVAEIIQATKRGAGSLPVSVKTRLGLQQIDFTWHEFLLRQKLNMLTIHGRTAKEMSKVPVHWDAVEHIRELRDQLSPATLIVGNGDIMNREEGVKLAKKYRLDGIMIGRGVFHDPYAFASPSLWQSKTKKQKIALFRQHVQLFADTWQNNERKIHTLNKFCKVYISDFDCAQEMREELMAANSAKEILSILNQH